MHNVSFLLQDQTFWVKFWAYFGLFVDKVLLKKNEGSKTQKIEFNSVIKSQNRQILKVNVRSHDH